MTNRTNRYRFNSADVIVAMYDSTNNMSLMMILRLFMDNKLCESRTKSVIIVEFRASEFLSTRNISPELRSLRFYYDNIVPLDRQTTDWCSLSERYNDPSLGVR